jgi:hypothetical protein
MRRFAQPQGITAAVSFLASDSVGFIMGQTLFAVTAGLVKRGFKDSDEYAHTTIGCRELWQTAEDDLS